MRYVVGQRLVKAGKNDTLERVDGLRVFNNLYRVIKSHAELRENDKLMVFNNLSDAETYLKILYKLNRKYHRALATHYGVDVNEFGYYLIKFDTPSMADIKLTKLLKKGVKASTRKITFEMPSAEIWSVSYDLKS